jgi:RNA polymerase sigma-70 factor, ECF subfamily
MQQLTDIEKAIIEQCRNGNLQDFRKLVETESSFVFSVAFRILGNNDDAEDTVQETMITLWRKIKEIKSADSFRPWLYRIIVNKCYDRLRKKKREPDSTADDKTWALISNKMYENPGTELENEELAIIINLLTDKLSAKQKAVFVLSEIEELSNDEISMVTGMTKLNIKANLHHARKRLNEMIQKHL